MIPGLARKSQDEAVLHRGVSFGGYSASSKKWWENGGLRRRNGISCSSHRWPKKEKRSKLIASQAGSHKLTQLKCRNLQKPTTSALPLHQYIFLILETLFSTAFYSYHFQKPREGVREVWGLQWALNTSRMMLVYVSCWASMSGFAFLKLYTPLFYAEHFIWSIFSVISE